MYLKLYKLASFKLIVNPLSFFFVAFFPSQGWVTTKLVPISIVIFLGASMNRVQRTGYLQRRKLREQKNGVGLKSE